MNTEMKFALQGKFLEDKREEEERKYNDYLSKLKTRSDEIRTKKQTEGLADWEKAVVEYIPLQDGEILWKKLAMAVNLAALGYVSLYHNNFEVLNTSESDLEFYIG